VTSASRPAIFTIPPHRSFADALAAGLLAMHRGDPMALARGIVLVPSNRAARSIHDAFVRRAGAAGLLLPRLVAIGDPSLDEALGQLFDPLDGDSIPPAIDPTTRTMILARLVAEARAASAPVSAAEAVRLAADLARTLDQLHIEQVDPARLREAVDPELSEHWQRSLVSLEAILSRWPEELARRGRIDLADRRNRLLARIAARWAAEPPAGFVVAAGVESIAPGIAKLLGVVARMPAGMVVLPGLDRAMPQDEWDSLGPHDPDPVTGRAPRSIETHPQFRLKRLLDRMGAGRADVERWRWGGGRDARAIRTRAINNAMAPPRATVRWARLKPDGRRLSGIRAAEFATPAEEAQGIAIALREAVETPGRTAALVTPDRALARRVVAHLRRWGIAADDSAGRPLAATPPGTLLIGLARLVAEGFAPVPLLGVLKHPLVRAGDARLEWLDRTRLLDLALRGPRPAPGLDGVARHLALQEDRAGAAVWWADAAALLRPLEMPAATLGEAFARLREAADALAGEAVWAGPAGRTAAELMESLEGAAGLAPLGASAEDVVRILRQFMGAAAVRPPQGGHPRVFIWGLIEARLQHADLMVVGGLNEGVWPALPSPDPWLAPRIRAALGLPTLEAGIGVAAHDFASALGAPQVLVTRARRDARAPAIASRFWLRLEAMTGGMTRAPRLVRWGAAIDRSAEPTPPASRPAPAPPMADRPAEIAVTRLDRLKADPFAFYADVMLRLKALDPVDADPGPAWRGTIVHDVLEKWLGEDGCDPDKLAPRARGVLEAIAAHPVQRALWAPRLIEAIEWVAREVTALRSEGRVPIAAERWGEARIGSLRLYGKVDRIDRLADGRLAIVDYKTGKPPSRKAVAEGFAMQLGLLGLIAERGSFGDIAGKAAAFEYWSLAAKGGELGFRESPVEGRTATIAPEDFTTHAAAQLAAAAQAWLTGEAPFVAKLHPEHAPYGDYDHLMRLEEWYGRDG